MISSAASRWAFVVTLLKLCDCCTPQQLFFASPPTWLKYQSCIAERHQTIDLGYVGANRAVEADCWCSTQVKQVVEDYGCNDHPSFKHLSPINCDDTCDSEKVKNCLEECPPLCLESDYAPESCDCETNNCLEHTRCITNKGRNDTASGTSDRVCHERDVEESPALVSYIQCMRTAELRTPWHRRNSKSHCECSSGLAESLESASCCASDWASPICKQGCLSDAACETEEARSCLSRCAEICEQVEGLRMSDACKTTCMDENSECAKWRTCKAPPRSGFDYVCGGGAEPMGNGCCKLPAHSGFVYQMGCPKLCDLRHVYMINRPGQDEFQCQCEGCPETEAKATFKWNATVKDSFWMNGQNVLADITRAVGLELGATREMQVLMKARNDAIKAAIDEHNNVYDDEIGATIERIAEAYHEEIAVVAMKRKACESKPHSEDCASLVPTAAPVDVASTTFAPTVNSGNVSDVSSSTVVVIVGTIAVALVCVGIVGLGFLVRRKKTQQQMANGTAVPIAGDNHVVVGRPVQSTSASSVSAGAPVQIRCPGNAAVNV